MTALVAIGGPLNGRELRRVPGAGGWFDLSGRAHSAPGPGRWLYLRAHGHLEFRGRGARQCAGCGATVEPDARDEALEACPLCGGRLDSLDADSRAILMGVPDRTEVRVQNLPSRFPSAAFTPRVSPECDGCGGESYDANDPLAAPYAASPDPHGQAVCSPLCELKVLMRVCDMDTPEQQHRRAFAVRDFVANHGIEGISALCVRFPGAVEYVEGPLASVSPYGFTLEAAWAGEDATVRWDEIADAKVVGW